jgi:hypothetical protein
LFGEVADAEHLHCLLRRQLLEEVDHLPRHGKIRLVIAEDLRVHGTDFSDPLLGFVPLVLVAGPLADRIGAGLAVLDFRRRPGAGAPHPPLHHRLDLGALFGGQPGELLLDLRHHARQLRAHLVGIRLGHLGVRLLFVVDHRQHLPRAVEDHHLLFPAHAGGFGAHPVALDLDPVDGRLPA